MTDMPRDLPPNWSEIDSATCWTEYVREVDRQVREEGAPIPEFLLSKRESKA